MKSKPKQSIKQILFFVVLVLTFVAMVWFVTMKVREARMRAAEERAGASGQPAEKP